MPRQRTITEILTDYSKGKIDHTALLKAMRDFPWQRIPKVGVRYDSAWEHDPPFLPGTTQEVIMAAAGRLITDAERNEILDIARTSGNYPPIEDSAPTVTGTAID